MKIKSLFIIEYTLFYLLVVYPGTTAWKKIKTQFGNDFIQENGELNRRKLGQIIFSDPAKRKILNSITHPEIYKSMLWKAFKAFVTGICVFTELIFKTNFIFYYLIKYILTKNTILQSRVISLYCFNDPG